MKTRHFITVGVPCYNNDSTIAQTIISLRDQSFQDWKCFIADDSTGPGTIERAIEAAAGDPRFNIVKNETRLGPAGNWNKVLTMAESPYFKLLCADDILYRDALQRECDALSRHPSAVVITARRDVIDSSGHILFEDRGFRADSEELSRSDVIRTFVRSGRNLFGEPSFALYDTAALRHGGGFNGHWQYTIDLVSYLQALEVGTLVHINEPLGAFRIWDRSWTSHLRGGHRKELRACLDFAMGLPDASCSSFDLLRGRALLLASTAGRNAVLSWITLRGRRRQKR